MVNYRSWLKPVLFAIFLVAVEILIGYSYGNLFNEIGSGKLKTIAIIIISPLFVAILPLLLRFRIQFSLELLLLLCWLPIVIPFIGFTLFEFGFWGLFLAICTKQIISRNYEDFDSVKYFPFLPFLIFMIGGLITFIFTPRTGSEFNQFMTFYIFPFILSLVLCLTIKSLSYAMNYIWILLLSALLLSLLFNYGQNISHFEIAMYQTNWRSTMEITIPYLGNLIIREQGAEIFAYPLVTTYGLWLFQKSFKSQLFTAIICAAFSLALLKAQARGGTIAAIISIIVCTVLYLGLKKTDKIRAILRFSVVLFFVIGGSFLLPFLSQNLAYQNRWTDLFTANSTDPSLIGRIANWKVGINEFIAQPFGIGFTGSKFEVTGNIWYVHDLWLYLLLGSGFIGCIGFVWIIFTLLKYFFTKLARSDPESSMFCIIGIGIITCLLVNGISSPVISDAYMVAFIYGPLAIALAVIKSEHLRLIKGP